MRTWIFGVLTAWVLLFAPRSAPAQQYWYGRYTPTGPNGYIYEAGRGWMQPPLYQGYYGYGYSPYARYGRAMPPYGFGNPSYNGYNDPYYGTYGPGVREFLRFGGADFYGW